MPISFEYGIFKYWTIATKRNAQLSLTGSSPSISSPNQTLQSEPRLIMGVVNLAFVRAMARAKKPFEGSPVP